MAIFVKSKMFLKTELLKKLANKLIFRANNFSEEPMSIGENIRKTRKEKELSQKALAERIKSDSSYINRIETGKINPTIAAVERIAQALECTIDQLVKDEETTEDVHILDKSLAERIRLLDAMDEDDRKAITHIIDALLTKKRIRELIDGNNPLAKPA